MLAMSGQPTGISVMTCQSRLHQPLALGKRGFLPHDVEVYRFARDRRTSWAAKAVVAALGAALVLSAQSVATTAEASDRLTRTNELLVRYELGAPPVRWNGLPWGSQCVTGALARGMRVGRWIGAGMRIIRFDGFVRVKTAKRVASQFEGCPYVLWAEPNGILLNVN
jgi:hypothetical protein